MTSVYRLQWSKCRHAQNSADETCRLPPGVMMCPCLGPQLDEDKATVPVANLQIDEGGQIIWNALDAQGASAAWYSLVATRDGDGKGEVVLFKPAKGIQPQRHNSGVSFEAASSRSGEVFVIRLDDLLEAGIHGVEYVRAVPKS